MYTVYRALAGVSILLLALLLASCSTSAYNQGSTFENYPEPDDKESWNQHFPSSAYITAWGVSTINPQLAEQNAQAAVAASVRSSIESELSSEMKSEFRQGSIHDSQKLESITKTRTYFEHAELIRPVTRTAHKKKNEFWVMAVLSRREAVDELMIPYHNEAVQFRFSAARLDSLKDDPPAFTKTWKKLKNTHTKMQPMAVEVRAVSGRVLKEINADEALFTQAELARLNLLNNLKIAVLLKNHPDIKNEVLKTKITRALTDLGLTVAGENCQPNTLKMNIIPETKWTNVVGRVVQLSLAGDFGLCDNETPWNYFVMEDRTMRGEGRKPIEDLNARLDSNFFREYFHSILDPYLPF